MRIECRCGIDGVCHTAFLADSLEQAGRRAAAQNAVKSCYCINIVIAQGATTPSKAEMYLFDILIFGQRRGGSVRFFNGVFRTIAAFPVSKVLEKQLVQMLAVIITGNRDTGILGRIIAAQRSMFSRGPRIVWPRGCSPKSAEDIRS